MIYSLCIIRIFWGGGRGGDTSKTPSPTTNNFCLYPPPVLRCFWKDHSMTPPPQFKHPSLLPPSLSTTPSPLNILMIHFLGYFSSFKNYRGGGGRGRPAPPPSLILQKYVFKFLLDFFSIKNLTLAPVSRLFTIKGNFILPFYKF